MGPPVEVCGETFDDDVEVIRLNGPCSDPLTTFIGQLRDLEVFEISSGNIQSLPTEIGRLTELTELIIRNNLITQVPSDLYKATKLREIDFSNNLITNLNIPPSQFSFNQLREINLRNNKLGSIQKELFSDGRVNELRRVFLSDNPIVEIPTHVGLLNRLSNMDIANALLTTVPTEIGSFNHAFDFRTLDLSNNAITDFPTELGRLSRLSILNIEQNDFEVLPEEMGKMTRLRELSIGPILCDCRLLEWYPDFIEDSRITNPFASTACKPVNEYEGNFPHLLRASSSAPCTHVTVDEAATETSDTAANVTWSFREVVPQDSFLVNAGVPAFNVSTLPIFISCTALELDDTEAYLGFEIILRNNEGEIVSRTCVPAGFLFQARTSADTTVYTESIDDLRPASRYELTVRPFKFESDPATLETVFSFGISSIEHRFQTNDIVPVTSPENATLAVATARELNVEWTALNEEFGEIVEYEVEVVDLESGEVLQAFSPITSIQLRSSDTFDFKPAADYSFRVRGRTTVPIFGPFSRSFNFSTCPLNFRFEEAIQEDCFALTGFFAFNGEAISCTVLDSDVLLDGGCDRDGIDVEDIPLRPGTWRASLTSLKVVTCPEEQFCQHSAVKFSTDADVYCTEKHQGILCFECVEGFALATEGCVECNDDTSQEGSLAMGLAVFMFIIFLFAMLMKTILTAGVCRKGAYAKWKEEKLMLEELQGKERKSEEDFEEGMEDLDEDEAEEQRKASLKDRMLRSKLMATSFRNLETFVRTKEYSEEPELTTISVKTQIFFGFNQVIFAYGRIFTAKAVPASLAGIIGFLTYVDFSAFFAEFKFRCVYDFSHYDDLLLRTLSPMLFISMLFMLTKAVQCARPYMRVELHYAYVSTFLFILFVVYPSVSQVVFETFWCQEFEQKLPNSSLNVVTLITDYRLSCYDRPGWEAYAGFMMLVYPIGIVLVYCGYLYSFRFLYYEDEIGVVDRRRLVKISFLIEPYKKRMYWFEAYELLRKLAQTSIVGVFHRDPQLMTFFAANVNLLATGLLIYLRPYKRDIDNLFACMSLFLLSVAIQFSARDSSGNTDLFPEIMINIIYVELALFLAFVIVDVYSYAKLKREARLKAQYEEETSSSRSHKSPRKRSEKLSEETDVDGDERIVVEMPR